MIHKIIEISNCGRFIDYKASAYDWKGVFGKNNTIYAENGSGKTTFAQILKSLSGNSCDLVEKRKSLQTDGAVRISIVDNVNKHYKFTGKKWSKNIPGIEVYDSYYSESNIYSISLGDFNAPSNFYDIVPDSNDLLQQIQSLREQRGKIARIINNRRREIKSANSIAERERLNQKLNRSIEKRTSISNQINNLKAQLDNLINTVGTLYINKVNYYLKQFNPSIEIKDANKKGHQLVYYINICEMEVRSLSSNIPLKHTLSEGDKSSLSLSFFLARLDLLPNISERIVVFDDPISSFDTRRRMMTISILTRIAKKVSQFFLLSHDINFVKAFCDKNENCTNLKIIWKEKSSVIVQHDINKETMTGITKDMYTLKSYLLNGAINDFERREVIRCMRPVIEGIFRLKYFSILKDREWLGDFLLRIKNSDESSPLYRLNEYYNELSDINDYCKQYHHSNPKYSEEIIFDEELRQFVEKTLNIIAYI